MVLPSLRLPTSALALAALLATGCVESTPPMAAPFEVRVENAGAAELRSVVVYVSASDSIRVAALPAGAATGYTAASAVHENPYVRASVGGRERALIPIEGFVPGFNAPRPPGRYTVSVAAGTGEHELGVSVRRE